MAQVFIRLAMALLDLILQLLSVQARQVGLSLMLAALHCCNAMNHLVADCFVLMMGLP